MSTPDQKPVIPTIDPPFKPSFSTLKTYLTSQEHTLNEVRDCLNDSQHLSDTDVRNLVGHIRKAFLKIMWTTQQSALWKIRCSRFGIDYARDINDDPAVTQDKSLERAFYRECDSSLEAQGLPSREEAIEMILDQVERYRVVREGEKDLAAMEARLAGVKLEDGVEGDEK